MRLLCNVCSRLSIVDQSVPFADTKSSAPLTHIQEECFYRQKSKMADLTLFRDLCNDISSSKCEGNRRHTKRYVPRPSKFAVQRSLLLPSKLGPSSDPPRCLGSLPRHVRDAPQCGTTPSSDGRPESPSRHLLRSSSTTSLEGWLLCRRSMLPPDAPTSLPLFAAQATGMRREQRPEFDSSFTNTNAGSVNRKSHYKEKQNAYIFLGC